LEHWQFVLVRRLGLLSVYHVGFCGYTFGVLSACRPTSQMDISFSDAGSDVAVAFPISGFC
jgi:hypothetical protein